MEKSLFYTPSLTSTLPIRFVPGPGWFPEPEGESVLGLGFFLTFVVHTEVKNSFYYVLVLVR